MKRLLLSCFLFLSCNAEKPVTEISIGSHVSAKSIDQAFLEKYCFDCHDSELTKGGLDLSALSWSLNDKENFVKWVKVYDNIASGNMPPKKKNRPDLEHSKTFLNELHDSLYEADKLSQKANGRRVYRRLTRSEYENSLRDLLKIPHLEVKDLLPEDGSKNGYYKIGEALNFSHVHLAKYLEAADRALNLATASQSKAPPILKRKFYPTESFKFHMNLTLGSAVLLKDRKVDPLWPVPNEKRDAPDLGKIKPPDFSKLKQSVALLTPNLEGWLKSMLFSPLFPGKYKVRFSTWSFQWNKGSIEPGLKPETARLHAGEKTIGYFDAPSMVPKIHEVTPWLDGGEDIIFDPASFFWTGLQTHQRKGGGMGYHGPAIVIDWLEAEGPFFESWPPESHKTLFGNLPLKVLDESTELNLPVREKLKQKGFCWPQAWHYPPADRPGNKIETVISDSPSEDAYSLLADFLPKAFRRPVEKTEIEKYVALVENRLNNKDCFELAMKHAYKAALTSVHFLFLEEKVGALNDFELASRLSYWLWSSTPDDELFKLAEQKKLSNSLVLKSQVDRMLNDSKNEAFVVDFTNQWLKLKDIDATDPDGKLYPEYNLFLRDCMLAETRAFFQSMVKNNLSTANIIDSNFAMLNQRLAEHYGVKGIFGNDIRKVELGNNKERGGLLTNAAVLKVTANGSVTSPVVRGVFVTDRILGKPIPPVPPGVSAVDPDTRGATTIREQLAKHRVDKCAACHDKIDPPGFALESYDVIGGFRKKYRSVEKGQQSDFKFPNGIGVYYKNGMDVDASGELETAQKFKDFTEFRALLLKDDKQLARSFLHHLISYSTGAGINFSDRAVIEEILTTVEKDNFGVKSMIHAVVQSSLFRSK